MRTRSVVPVLVALSAGIAAAAAVRRFVGLRRTAPTVVPAAPAAAPAAVAEAIPAAVGVQAAREAVRGAVVLPFTRTAAPAPAAPALPARCGESGGRTKAGAPCASRATVQGRCHHHRVAA